MVNPIYSDLLKIFSACVEAVAPKKLLRRSIQYNSDTEKLILRDKELNLKNKNVYLIGTGKAVLNMARETEMILGSKIKQGIVSVPMGAIGKSCMAKTNVKYFEGAENNLPDMYAARTAKYAKDLARNLNENDFLIVLISGGGSALLPLPHDSITLDEKLSIIKKLGNAGANIAELNTVRKKLSGLKGGQLALEAQPAEVVALILSDIVGDPLDLIASGPTSKNNDTSLESKNILKKYNLYSNLSDTIKNILEENVQSREFPVTNVYNYIIGSNKMSIAAAVEQAKEFNYFTIELSNMVTGNVKNVAKEYEKLISLINGLISRKICPLFVSKELKNINIAEINENWISNIVNIDNRDICIILGGETTVEVKGTGIGGRNQQLVLELSNVLYKNKENFENIEITFLCAGTDGIDGPTDAAGAIGYLDLISDAERQGFSVNEYIEKNDSYSFFKGFEKGAFHVITGHTNTNVMDIHIIKLKRK